MSEYSIRLSSNEKLQQIIRENYNFNILDIIKKAFASTKGLMLKFFSASLIILAINLILLGLSIAMMPSPQNFTYQYKTSPPMPSIEIIMFRVFMLFNIMINNVLVAGFAQITLRHLRKEHNPLISGLFSFFPIMGRLIFISIILLIFILIPILVVEVLPQFIDGSLWLNLLFITLYCGIFSIAIFYSLVLFIMADYPRMRFWKVMETSRKFIMNRWLKIGSLYLILSIICWILIKILLLLITGAFMPLLIVYNPDIYITTMISYFFFVYGITLLITSLWLMPFLSSVHGLIYLHLINDPYLDK